MDELIDNLRELIIYYAEEDTISILEEVRERFIMDIIDVFNTHTAEAEFKNILQDISLQEAYAQIEDLRQEVARIQNDMLAMVNMYGEAFESVQEMKDQEIEFLQVEKENKEI